MSINTVLLSSFTILYTTTNNSLALGATSFSSQLVVVVVVNVRKQDKMSLPFKLNVI